MAGHSPAHLVVVLGAGASAPLKYTPAEEVRLFRETIDQLKEWKVNVYAIPAPQAGASASESDSPE
jgi:hypothetical protein